MPNAVRRALLGFLSGMLAVLVFQQTVRFVATAAGWPAAQPWPAIPLAPLPALLQTVVWGGLWGALFGAFRGLVPGPTWLAGICFGLAGPLLVETWIVVPAARGLLMFSGYFVNHNPRQLQSEFWLIGLAYGAGLGIVYAFAVADWLPGAGPQHHLQRRNNAAIAGLAALVLFGGGAAWVASSLASLDNWSAQLSRLDDALSKSDLDGVRRGLKSLEQETASVSWANLPVLSDRLAAVRLATRSKRKEFAELEKLTSDAAAWEKVLATLAGALARGDLPAAEEGLKEVEAKLSALAAPGRTSVLSPRIASVRQQAQKLRTELDRIRKVFADAVQSLAIAMQQAIERRDAVAATAAAAQARLRGGQSNPVVRSFSLFAQRQIKLGTLRGAALAQVIARMQEQAAEWHTTRGADQVAAYIAFLRTYPQSPYGEEARARIVDLEVAEIRRSRPPSLPAATEVSSAPGRTYSVINVHNSTSYELTLRYSGPDSFMVILTPNEKSSIELLVGKYIVAASVKAANVRNYAGDQDSTGGNFQVTFYIQSSLYGNLPALLPPAPLLGFTPWPLKRALPAYLR